jgi:uncharacterized protein YodC (DUF2158 family)
MSGREEKFKEGDVVQLLSGGPKMTVSGENNRPYYHVYCVWFSNDGNLHRKLFEEGVLQKDNNQYF